MSTEPTIEKLSRTDLIKLVAGEVLEQMAGAVKRAEEGVTLAREEFDRCVRERALGENQGVLHNMAMVCNFEVADVVVTVPRCIYADNVLPIDVPCTIMNSSVPYERRMSIEVRVALFDTSEVRTRALALKQALQYRNECEQQDARVSVVKESVRKDLVADLLKGEGGEELMEAAKKLAVIVKARILQGGE